MTVLQYSHCSSDTVLRRWAGRAGAQVGAGCKRGRSDGRGGRGRAGAGLHDAGRARAGRAGSRRGARGRRAAGS